MDAEKLHKMIKPLPSDFDEFIRERFQGAWTGYVGTYTPEPQFLEETKPEKMLYCTHCQTYMPTDIKLGGKYNADTNPRKVTICPNCLEELGLYSMNKKTTATERHQTFWIGQNLGNKIFVLRGFRVTIRVYSPAMEYGEEIIKQEIRRLYISPDEYYKEYCGWGYNPVTHEYDNSYWTTRAAGFASASGPIYPKTYEAVKGTGAEYSCLKIAQENGIFNDEENWSDRWGTSGAYYCSTNNKDSIWKYLNAYAENRRVEMLTKLNMPYLIGMKMRGYPTGLNGRAKNPWDYLKIYKSRLKGFQCTDGNEYKLLEIYRMERKFKLNFTDEEVKTLKELDVHRIGDCLKYMTVKQLVNRVKKYSKTMKKRVPEVMTTYSDYLKIKAELGYDMKNSIFVYPRDLKAEHDKVVIEKSEKESNELAQKMNIKFANIEKRFKKANKLYSFQSGKLFIRPAKCAAEIVNEGRLLHHCVGGETYLSKHANKKSIILFLRTEEDVPYITVEMKPDGQIAQWYGDFDEKPDKAKIQKWLNKYTKQLDKRALEKEAHTKGA